MRAVYRGVILWGVVGLFAQAWSQTVDFEQPITFRQPAITVKQLLETLSQQTGVRLTAAPPIRDEFVLVAVEGMPLKELMEHLAYVTDGEWVEQEDGSHRLTRTPRVAQRRRAEDDAQILQRWREVFFSERFKALAEPLTAEQLRDQFSQVKETLRKALDKHDPNQTELDSETRKALDKAFSAMDIDYRLVVRLLQRMDLKRLLAIPVGEKRVFSNVPGRYLTPFGFSVQPLLEQYLRERELLRTVWRSGEGFDEELWSDLESRYKVFSFGYHRVRSAAGGNSTYTQVYLAIERVSPFFLRFRLSVTDASQQESQYKRFLEEILSSVEEFENTSPPVVAKIEWSETTRQFLETVREFFRTTEASALPPLLDPARTEPLSLIPSDVMLTYAKHKKKNLVALVDDSLCSFTELYLDAHATPDVYMRFLMVMHEERESEKVVSLRPKWSSYSWFPRVDRGALSQLMHQILKDKHPRLSHFLEYARITHKRQSELARVYVELFLQDLLIISSRLPEFLITLTPQQRESLLGGNSLMLSQLSPAQKETLFKDLYHRYDSLAEVEVESGQDAPRRGAPRYLQLYALFPNGIPDEAQVSLSQRTSQGVFTKRRAGVWSSFEDALLLVYRQQLVEDESLPPSLQSRYQEEYERYRMALLNLANEKRYALNLRLGDFRIRLSDWGTELVDFELSGVKPFTLENAPEEFKKLIEAQKERLLQGRSRE